MECTYVSNRLLGYEIYTKESTFASRIFLCSWQPNSADGAINENWIDMKSFFSHLTFVHLLSNIFITEINIYIANSLLWYVDYTWGNAFSAHYVLQLTAWLCRWIYEWELNFAFGHSLTCIDITEINIYIYCKYIMDIHQHMRLIWC